MAVDDIVAGAYCALSDLRIGDIRLPAIMGDGTQDIQRVSDEIDAALGHIYQTPITFELVNNELPMKSRPSMLTLKKINWLIASGRIVLQLNASNESDSQHAYGMGMLKEGLELLRQLVVGEMQLVGAIKLEPEEGSESNYTGPQIYNEDPDSLVKSFYERQGINVPSAAPYGLVQPRYLGLI